MHKKGRRILEYKMAGRLEFCDIETFSLYSRDVKFCDLQNICNKWRVEESLNRSPKKAKRLQKSIEFDLWNDHRKGLINDWLNKW